MNNAIVRFLLFVLCVAALTGCGPGRGDVTGTVTHQKRPLAGATITFYDAADGAVSGTVKEDGTYSVTNVAVGASKIAIVPPMAISMPGKPAPKVPAINPKYTDREKSGLTFDVKSGANTFPIEIE